MFYIKVVGFKDMLNQRPNSDGDPVLPTERTYTHDLRAKNTSLYTNVSTFHALAHINLFNQLTAANDVIGRTKTTNHTYIRRAT